MRLPQTLQFQVFVDDIRSETEVFWGDLTKADVVIVKK